MTTEHSLYDLPTELLGVIAAQLSAVDYSALLSCSKVLGKQFSSQDVLFQRFGGDLNAALLDVSNTNNLQLFSLIIDRVPGIIHPRTSWFSLINFCRENNIKGMRLINGNKKIEAILLKFFITLRIIRDDHSPLENDKDLINLPQTLSGQLPLYAERYLVNQCVELSSIILYYDTSRDDKLFKLLLRTNLSLGNWEQAIRIYDRHARDYDDQKQLVVFALESCSVKQLIEASLLFPRKFEGWSVIANDYCRYSSNDKTIHHCSRIDTLRMLLMKNDIPHGTTMTLKIDPERDIRLIIASLIEIDPDTLEELLREGLAHSPHLIDTNVKKLRTAAKECGW